MTQLDENTSINGPLRTLYLVRQQVLIARPQVERLWSRIEGQNWPHIPEALRDARDTLNVHLDSVVAMCDRWEPFRIEPEPQEDPG